MGNNHQLKYRLLSLKTSLMIHVVVMKYRMIPFTTLVGLPLLITELL
jgi:hypothetical protein